MLVKGVDRVNNFVVAERRLSLARSFKAGLDEANEVPSRQRRLSVSAVADATMFLALLIPALKDRAKFNRRYAPKQTQSQAKTLRLRKLEVCVAV